MALQKHWPRSLNAEVVHSCPPRGSSRTPCCDKVPFELPMTDRLTLDESLVTCGKEIDA